MNKIILRDKDCDDEIVGIIKTKLSAEEVQDIINKEVEYDDCYDEFRLMDVFSEHDIFVKWIRDFEQEDVYW